jgi:hypothetical protein
MCLAIASSSIYVFIFTLIHQMLREKEAYLLTPYPDCERCQDSGFGYVFCDDQAGAVGLAWQLVFSHSIVMIQVGLPSDYQYLKIIHVATIHVHLLCTCPSMKQFQHHVRHTTPHFDGGIEPLRCCSIQSSHDRHLHNKHTPSALFWKNTLHNTPACLIAILPHERRRATSRSRVPSPATPLLTKVPVLGYVYPSAETAGRSANSKNRNTAAQIDHPVGFKQFVPSEIAY